MKTNKDFELFQKEFKKWQKLFGLIGYQVYFKYEPLDGSFACINVKQGDSVATVRLNSVVSNDDKPYRDVRKSAKHEAIHLLIGRLEMNGRYRYTSETELYEAAEELVVRLEGLI